MSRIDAMSCGLFAFLRTKRRPMPMQDQFGFCRRYFRRLAGSITENDATTPTDAPGASRRP